MMKNLLRLLAAGAALSLCVAPLVGQAPKPQRINRAVELLAQGQPIYYTGSHEGTEGNFEQGVKDAQTYADYISYDMEHAPFDVKGLADYMRGLAKGGPTKSGHRTPPVIVNVPVNGTDEASVRANAWMFQQVLATGVHGVLLCHADTPGAVRRGALRAADRSRESIAGHLRTTGVRTIEEVLTESVAPERLNSFLVGIFAALALLLAAAGIYGVLSYSVTRQTREIGIRMALGAKSSEVLGLVMSQALRLVGAGLIIGLAGAFALTRVLAGFLYGITPTDPWTFAGVSAFLAAVAMAAAYIPASRATRVDPMEALRYE